MGFIVTVRFKIAVSNISVNKFAGYKFTMYLAEILHPFVSPLTLYGHASCKFPIKLWEIYGTWLKSRTLHWEEELTWQKVKLITRPHARSECLVPYFRLLSIQLRTSRSTFRVGELEEIVA